MPDWRRASKEHEFPSDSRSKNSMDSDSSKSYPVDTHGFVRQCAWCRRIADTDGQYRLLSATLVQGASHGCCEACAIRFLGHYISKRHLAA
jgi:hypothetical protein